MGRDFDNFDLEDNGRPGRRAAACWDWRCSRSRWVRALPCCSRPRKAPRRGASWVPGSKACVATRKRRWSECSRRSVGGRSVGSGSAGSSALMGLALGAGLATLLTPESGPSVRRRIGEHRRRITERLRRHETEVPDIDRVVREPQPDPEPAA